MRRTGRRERWIFTAALAAIAAHACVDAFVAPEPGTAWDDHLVRGIATLAILAGAFFAYVRVRPGIRAAIAAALGALAVAGAALAVVDARASAPRGEDWTGFALAPAGVAFCGLAAVLLWRSRKPGRLRYPRRAGIAIGSIVGAYLLVVPVTMALVATHRPRHDVGRAALGRAYRPVTIRTADGLHLAGWYVPSRNGAAVVSYPTRAGKIPQAQMLVRHGYGVLLLDARGYDGSDGDANLFGWSGPKDIDAAVAWLRRRGDVRHGAIGGIGFSVGGEAMLTAAATNSALRAVVSEGAGERSVRETLIRGPRGWLAVPEAAVQTTALALLSGTAPPPSLEALVARISPRPVLLIYAGRGVDSEALNRDFFRAAREPKQIWRIANARHVGGFQTRPLAYERRVIAFFDAALHPRSIANEKG